MDDTLKKEFARFLRDYFSEGKEKIVSDETMAADWKIGHKEVRNLLKRMVLSLVHESEAREQEMIPEGGEASLKPVHLGFTEIGQDTKGRHLFASLNTLKNLLKRVFSRLPTLLNENETYQAFQELTGEKDIDPARLKTVIPAYTPLIRFFENNRGGAATLNLFRFLYPEREVFVSKNLVETVALKTAFFREEKKGLFSKKERPGTIDSRGIIETAFALTFSEIGRLIIPLKELYDQKAFRSYFEEDRLQTFIEKEIQSFYTHQPTIKDGVLNLFPENWIDLESVAKELKQKTAEGIDPNRWLKERYPFLNKAEIGTLLTLFVSPASKTIPSSKLEEGVLELSPSDESEMLTALTMLEQENETKNHSEKEEKKNDARESVEKGQKKMPGPVNKTESDHETSSGSLSEDQNWTTDALSRPRAGREKETRKADDIQDSDGEEGLMNLFKVQDHEMSLSELPVAPPEKKMAYESEDRSDGGFNEDIEDLMKRLTVTNEIVSEPELKEVAEPVSSVSEENRGDTTQIREISIESDLPLLEPLENKQEFMRFEAENDGKEIDLPQKTPVDPSLQQEVVSESLEPSENTTKISRLDVESDSEEIKHPQETRDDSSLERESASESLRTIEDELKITRFETEENEEAIEILGETRDDSDQMPNTDVESLKPVIENIAKNDFEIVIGSEEIEFEPDSGETENKPGGLPPLAILTGIETFGPEETEPELLATDFSVDDEFQNITFLEPPQTLQSDFAVEELSKESAEKIEEAVPPIRKDISVPSRTPSEETAPGLRGKIISVLTDNEELSVKIGLLSGITGFELRDSLAYMPDIAVFDRDFEYLMPIAKNTGVKVYMMHEFLKLLGLS